MAQYTGIQGQNILIVSSDPANPTEGQIWYNSTSNLLKGYQFLAVNSWATGGNLNTARTAAAGSGTQTAALSFGGSTATALTGATESYNGSTWTTLPATMPNTIYRFAGCGTQTASLGFAGYKASPQSWPAVTQSYDGTSWSTPPANMNTPRANTAGFGTQTAAVASNGFGAPFTLLTATELYNGSTWTSSGNTGSARYDARGVGISTAGIIFGGDIYPLNPGTRFITSTESFNGSTWTAVNSMNTATAALGGSGNQTAALGFGGYTLPGARSAKTEIWNGTSWTTSPSVMSTARSNLSSSGTQTAGLGFGGRTAAVVANTNTEEWTGTVLTTRTFTTS